MSRPTAKILLNPTRRAWTQVYEEENLVVLLSLDANGEASDQEAQLSATEVGHNVLAQLEILRAQNTTLSEIVTNLHKSFIENKLSIAAASVKGNNIVFIKEGGVQIWAIRDGLPFRLNSDSFSGSLSSGDIFVLGTEEFFESVTKLQLENAFEGKTTVDEIADQASPFIHRLDNPKAGAIILKPEPQNEPEEAESPTFVPPAQTGYYRQQGIATPQNLEGLKLKGANFWKKILIKFAHLLPEREFQVKPGQEGSTKRRALSIAIVLLFLLVVSIFLGAKQHQQKAYKDSYKDRLDRAKVLFQDAVAAKGTNLLSARDSFNQSKAIVESLGQEGVHDPGLTQLKSDLDSQESDILGQSHVPATLFLDLSLVRPDINAVEIKEDKDRLAVLDQKGERVIFVGSANKDTSVAGKISQAQALGVLDDNAYVLGSEGILEVSKTGTSKKVVDKDNEWSNPVKVNAFGSSIYLLEKGGVIWKYPATSTGFGAKQKWLESQNNLPGPVVDWTFDGSVYVLSENGEVSKFTRGANAGFRISGLPKPLAKAVSLYTSPELSDIFILDSEAGKVIEVDKTGAYQFEYVVDQAKGALSLTASQTAGKIFLLSQNKIWQVPLKK